MVEKKAQKESGTAVNRPGGIVLEHRLEVELRRKGDEPRACLELRSARGQRVGVCR
jgi:hypothetical protein